MLRQNMCIQGGCAAVVISLVDQDVVPLLCCDCVSGECLLSFVDETGSNSIIRRFC